MTSKREESCVRSMCGTMLQCVYHTGKGCASWAVFRVPYECDCESKDSCAEQHYEYSIYSNLSSFGETKKIKRKLRAQVVAYGMSEIHGVLVTQPQFEEQVDVAAGAVRSVIGKVRIREPEISSLDMVMLVLATMGGVEDIDFVVCHDYYSNMQRIIDAHHDLVAIPSV